jgi:hypothetical protein
VRLPLLVLACLLAAPAAALDCSIDDTAPVLDRAGPATAAGLDSPDTTPLPLLGEHGADLSVAAVLQRLRDAECAKALVSADGYQKQTEFDNTPYRYNMQPGQKLNAAEFDAWMQSRGIRIVKARDTSPALGDGDAAPAAVAE